MSYRPRHFCKQAISQVNLDRLAYLLSCSITASGFKACIETKMQALLKRNMHRDIRRVYHASIAQNADQRGLRQAQDLSKRSSTRHFRCFLILCALQVADARVIY